MRFNGGRFLQGWANNHYLVLSSETKEKTSSTSGKNYVTVNWHGQVFTSQTRFMGANYTSRTYFFFSFTVGVYCEHLASHVRQRRGELLSKNVRDVTGFLDRMWWVHSTRSWIFFFFKAWFFLFVCFFRFCSFWLSCTFCKLMLDVKVPNSKHYFQWYFSPFQYFLKSWSRYFGHLTRTRLYAEQTPKSLLMCGQCWCVVRDPLNFFFFHGQHIYIGVAPQWTNVMLEHFQPAYIYNAYEAVCLETCEEN